MSRSDRVPPSRGLRRPAIAWLAAVVLGAGAAAPDDDSRLSLADLPAYRAALVPAEGKGTGKEQAPRVSFRDLWSHPERYAGRRVQVEGRVVRRFRQPPYGSFPALAEAWAVAPSGDPFCLVFPAAEGKSEPGPGTVRFEGTFLKLIRYQGGDVPRLAPLLIGPRAPVPAPSPAAEPPGQPHVRASPPLDWIVGAVAAIVVAAVLAWNHAQRPFRGRSPAELGPPPCFEESIPQAEAPPGTVGPESIDKVDGSRNRPE